MSAVDIVVHKLHHASAVTQVVAQRVYPILAPQGAAGPYITVHLIDNMDLGVHLGGSGKYWRSIVQVDCLYPGDMTGAASFVVDLGERVIAALDGAIKESLTAYMGSYRDVDILLGNGDSTEYDLDRNSFRRLVRFQVTWRDAS